MLQAAAPGLLVLWRFELLGSSLFDVGRALHFAFAYLLYT
jgi:hypothetical protein